MFFLGFAALRAGAFAEDPGQSVTPPLRLANCLPAAIKLTDVVEAVGSHKITVEKKLNDLKATCNRENKLVDGNGRPIVFYHLVGCWGYPPPDYREIMQKQRREIERLKQQNTVIEMTCNPSGVHIP